MKLLKIQKTLKTKTFRLEKKIPDATNLIHLNEYNTDKQNLEKKSGDVDKKISDMNGLVTTTILNTKIIKIENKIPNTSSLANTTILNTKINKVKNKILDHTKYITTQEVKKLRAENFATRLKQADLVNKTDFDNKLTSFNR